VRDARRPAQGDSLGRYEPGPALTPPITGRIARCGRKLINQVVEAGVDLGFE